MREYILHSYCVSHIFLLIYTLLFTSRRYSIQKSMMLVTGTIGILIGLEWIGYCYGAETGIRLMVFLMQIALALATAIILSEYRDYRALFTGMSAANYVLLGNFVGLFFYTHTQNFYLGMLMNIMIHLILLAVLVHFLRTPYLQIQSLHHKAWRILCLIPALFYAAIYLLFVAYKHYSSSIAILLASISVMLTMYVSYILVFQMIHRINGEELAKKDQDMLRSSIKALKWEMEEVHAAREQVILYRHDSRHFIRGLQILMQEEDYGAVNQALEDCVGMAEGSPTVHFCDNLPIAHYVAAAQSRQILMQVKLEPVDQLTVNDWELAAIIGNLLENAIHACLEIPKMEKRKIMLSAKKTHHQLLIEITNPYAGTIRFSPESGLPLSAGGEGHGVGMRSVVYFAKRNQAVFDCGTQDGVFFARLLL
ncbi:MAG: GHKL domain-containing protein [Hungatella sp.]